GHESDVGMQLLDARGDGHDLLDVLAAHHRREEARARAGDEDPVDAGRQAGVGLHPPEELEDLFRLTGVVPLIVAPGDAVLVDHDGLDGGGPAVDAGELHDAAAPAVAGRAPGAAVSPASDPRILPRPMRSATWSARLAAVPVATPWCGTRYVAHCRAG